MSITKELREWAEDNTLQDMVLATYPPQHAVHGVLETLLAIADRIDAEHERVREEDFERTRDECYEDGWRNGYDEGLIEGLKSVDDWHPRDADNVPIEIGDMLVLQHEVWEKPYEVLSISFDGNDWFFDSNEGRFNVAGWHHYHASIVEDVLREFAYVGIRIGSKDGIEAGKFTFYPDEDMVAEYASKLQLREDA